MNKENLIAYLEIKLSMLSKSATSEVCSSIRAECADMQRGYMSAISDIKNYLNPDFDIDVDYEEIQSHLAAKHGLDI